MTLVLQNSDKILSHEGFTQMCPKELSFLLSREVIQVASEQEVIDSVITWAYHQIENSESLENIRQALEQDGILQQLRILALSKDKFIDFITGPGKEIFSEDELEQLEYNYFSDSCESFVNPIRVDRMLEQRIPVSGTDYLAVDSETNTYDVNVKIFETDQGVRPFLKMIVIPSQLNPANILYDNVSHRTHYNECILVEISVNEKVVARGSFYDRIKYSDDINITLNTFNHTPIYASNNNNDEDFARAFYEANVNIIFKKYGYYPLAVETKNDPDSPVILQEPCRFITEFVLTSPKP